MIINLTIFDIINCYKKTFKINLKKRASVLRSSLPGLADFKETAMKEIWKDIENFEGLYQVSNLLFNILKMDLL